MVGFPVEFHHLQGFILLQKVRGVFGKKRFDLLHVVGPGKFHRFVPLEEENSIQSEPDHNTVRLVHDRFLKSEFMVLIKREFTRN